MAALSLVTTVIAVVTALVIIGIAIWVVVAATGRARGLALTGFTLVLLNQVLSVVAPFLGLAARDSLAVLWVLHGVLFLTALALLGAAVVTACQEHRAPATPWATGQPYPAPAPWPHPAPEPASGTVSGPAPSGPEQPGTAAYPTTGPTWQPEDPHR